MSCSETNNSHSSVNNLLLREIWSVNSIISDFGKKYPDFYQTYSLFINQQIKECINLLRKDILENRIHELPEKKVFVNSIKLESEKFLENGLKKVINATGVILHTNLGRAPISKELVSKISNVLTGYSNLEFDLNEGKRGKRDSYLIDLLKKIFSSESALVLNNNAASVFLICNTFAFNKEVIVSRGELIEIGGSFRLPEIIIKSSSILREVGTTNKTYIHDYENAITENTGLLLKSNTSNYKIIGFTNEVKSQEIYDLGKRNKIITYEDIGSGLVISSDILNISNENTISEKVNCGIDLISFSGDKLLGGGQAGIILGKENLINKLKSNPLYRAFRIDKINLSILENTLLIYLKNIDKSINEIPILKMISESYNSLLQKTQKLYNNIKSISSINEIEIIESYSMIGGGTSPENKIKTPVLTINSKFLSPEKISKKLREYKIPIIGIINEEKFIINLRTVFDEDIINIQKALISIL